jgi:hypothetical protein
MVYARNVSFWTKHAINVLEKLLQLVLGLKKRMQPERTKKILM